MRKRLTYTWIDLYLQHKFYRKRQLYTLEISRFNIATKNENKTVIQQTRNMQSEWVKELRWHKEMADTRQIVYDFVQYEK